MTIRVFSVNDIEWWAGDGSPEDILDAYMAETGTTHEEATGDDEDLPREVSDADMERLKVCDEHGTIKTFREELDRMISKGDSFPCPFAATDW